MITREVLRRATADVSAELAQWSRNGGMHADEGEAVDVARRLVEDWLSRHARDCIRRGEEGLSPSDEQATAVAVLDHIFGLGDLQPYVDDPSVESIFVNGYDTVFVRRSGEAVVAVPPVGESDAELESLVRRLAAREGMSERRFDESSPFLNLTLRDGSRLHAAMGVCAQPTLTIRRHRLLDASLDDLVDLRMLTGELRRLLEAAIVVQSNVVIAGGPNAGKSSLLRTLAAAIPPDMRVVTIEDTHELLLDRDRERHPNCVALEARPANVQGAGAITLADLVYQALRMGPDVLIVGEVRGPEVVPMLDALSAGNAAGSMCTVHARSTLGTFDRLKGLLAQSPERYGAETSASLIATAVDLVVHIATTPSPDGSLHRWVDSVQEVRHAEGATIVSNEIVRVDPQGRMRAAAAMSGDLKERLFEVGYDVTEWEGVRVTAVAALGGALTGLGLLLLVSAMRGVDLAAPRWPPSLAGIDHLALRVCVALLAGALVGLVTGWPVAALATAVLVFAAPMMLETRGERERRLQRLAAVASWAEMLRDTLSAGLGIETAIRASATAAPLPIRAELELLANELGGPDALDDALRRFAGRVDNPTCDRAVAALLLPRGSGTLSQRLSSIAEAAQRDVDMRRRVDVEREGTRWTARLIVVITASMAMGLALLNRSYLEPYGSAVGQLVLLVIVAAFGAGYIWLSRISNEPPAPRLVVGGEGDP